MSGQAVQHRVVTQVDQPRRGPGALDQLVGVDQHGTGREPVEDRSLVGAEDGGPQVLDPHLVHGRRLTRD